MPLRHLLVTAWIASLLSGCGTAYVMREDAGQVAQSAAAAIAVARERYDQIAAKQMDFYLEVLTSDGNCRPFSPMLVEFQQGAGPPLRCLSQAEILQRSNCSADGKPAICNKMRRIEALDLGKLGFGRQSALTLIEIISDYQVVLSGIVAGQVIDTQADVKSLEKRLASLCMAVGIAECSTTPSKEAENEKEKQLALQIEAAANLLQVFREMKSNADALAALRNLLADSSPSAPAARFARALENLESSYLSVHRAVEAALEERCLSKLSRDIVAEMCVDPSANNDPNECAATALQGWLNKPQTYRIERFRAVFEERRKWDAQRAAPDPLAVSFGKLRTIHVQLTRAVLDENYSEEQRKRIADRNLAELKSIFTATRGLVSVFGVL